MAVLQMKKMNICGVKGDRKPILERLQSLGVMEIHREDIPDCEGFSKMDTKIDISLFEKNMRLINNALSILDKYVPEKKGMLSTLEGKKTVKREEFDKITSGTDELLLKAKAIVSLEKEISEKKAHIIRFENQTESITPWLGLDIPMDLRGTKHTSIILGTMPKEITIDELNAVLMGETQGVTAVDCNVVAEDRDLMYVCIFCLTCEKVAVEAALRINRFTKLQYRYNKTPNELIDEFKNEIISTKEEVSQCEAKIKKQVSLRGDLKLIDDYFRMRKTKYELIGNLLQSKNTFIMSGYIPAKYEEAVRMTIEDEYACAVFVSELSEDDDPPTILTNNKFSESMEGVVESYGLPHRGEFDPTGIMSFFYVFFFGLMLSDAAYGAIMAGLCFAVLKKFPNMSRGTYKNIKMFMFCGLTTMFWGVMFGGYFGDVIQVVARTFLNKEVTVPALWFEPLGDPMRLLLWCMGFGVIHLFVGLGIKGYQQIKARAYMDFMCDVILWYVFLIGLILLLLPTDIFASISRMNIVFPHAVNVLAKGMAITGAAGLLLMSGREQKNPALRIALGAYDIYNITGWLSDVLSYSRLLALGLATGVIASVVNQMGSMTGSGIIGVILFTIIFIIGHLLNMAINLLGAYVHTNRLQFVEFFSKFYEGGGRPFKPFIRDTEYIDLKEEL